MEYPTGYVRWLRGLNDPEIQRLQRKDAQQTKILLKDDEIIVDTCWVYDLDRWETGVYPSKTAKSCIIVEEYATKEDAIKGHEKWVKALTENPKMELKACRDALDWGYGRGMK